MTPQDRRWGSFELRPETIVHVKSILERDFGTPLPWNDDEVKAMTHNVLHLLDVLVDSLGFRDKGRDSNFPLR